MSTWNSMFEIKTKIYDDAVHDRIFCITHKNRIRFTLHRHYHPGLLSRKTGIYLNFHHSMAFYVVYMFIVSVKISQKLCWWGHTKHHDTTTVHSASLLSQLQSWCTAVFILKFRIPDPIVFTQVHNRLLLLDLVVVFLST
jgi:hypothetical protein